MTVPNTTRSVSYPGDDSGDVFAYTFKIFAAGDLVVTLRASGVDTVQTLGVDYTVSGAGAVDGGNVTMVTPPATGETLFIERVLPMTQVTDLRNTGSFLPESIENTLDRAAMIAQQLAVGGVGAAGLELWYEYYTDSPDTRPTATAGNKGRTYLVQNVGGNTRKETIYEKAAGGFGRKVDWQTHD
jgi:hypothetical protein